MSITTYSEYHNMPYIDNSWSYYYYQWCWLHNSSYWTEPCFVDGLNYKVWGTL